MNITALNTTAPQFTAIPNADLLDDTASHAAALFRTNDIVDVNELPDMSDEEVDSLMNETIRMIGNDSVNALSVHSGIDPNRVFTLLGLAQ